MPRMARIVVPGYPHHVTQRGSRRQQTFFEDADYLAYLDLIGELKESSGVDVWAYCLMPNHVHVVAVPQHKQSLANLFGVAHHRYAYRVNLAHEWDSQVYVLYEHEGREIELEADSDSADVGMYVVDVGGYWVMYADDGFKGREAGSFTTEFEAPYFVDFFNYSPYSQMASISANRRLIPFVDLDDGRGIAPE